MRPYELEFEPSVVDEIRELPREDQRAVVHRCGDLASEPRPTGFEKIEFGFRIRYRSYVIVYLIDDANRFVSILRVRSVPPDLDG